MFYISGYATLRYSLVHASALHVFIA